MVFRRGILHTKILLNTLLHLLSFLREVFHLLITTFVICIGNTLFGRTYLLGRQRNLLQIFSGKSPWILVLQFIADWCRNPSIELTLVFCKFDDTCSASQVAISIETRYTSVSQGNFILKADVIIVVVVTDKDAHHITLFQARNQESAIEIRCTNTRTFFATSVHIGILFIDVSIFRNSDMEKSQ